ncbi:MAG: hypothetical protein OEW37_00410 [Rhodospirillaceae bacterium]|nr:hypothetical protein [Rhodospirillaceae bacterium]
MSNILSDIIIAIKDSVDDAEAKIISSAIYAGNPSALISFNSKSQRIFLVRFDPEIDTPQSILEAARSVRPDAVMAGG